MNDEILDVDLLAFERGDASARAAVVDGVMRSQGVCLELNELLIRR